MAEQKPQQHHPPSPNTGRGSTDAPQQAYAARVGQHRATFSIGSAQQMNRVAASPLNPAKTAPATPPPLPTPPSTVRAEPESASPQAKDGERGQLQRSQSVQRTGTVTFDERVELQALKDKQLALRSVIGEYQSEAQKAIGEREAANRALNSARAETESLRSQLALKTAELQTAKENRDAAVKQARECEAAAAETKKLKETLSLRDKERALLKETVALLHAKLRHVARARQIAEQEVAILRAALEDAANAAPMSGVAIAPSPSPTPSLSTATASKLQTASSEEASESSSSASVAEQASEQDMQELRVGVETVEEGIASISEALAAKEAQLAALSEEASSSREREDERKAAMERLALLRAEGNDPFETAKHCFGTPDIDGANVIWLRTATSVAVTVTPSPPPASSSPHQSDTATALPPQQLQPAKELRCATLDKIVELMTGPASVLEHEFVGQFLLGFRLFATAESLLQTFIARFASAGGDSGSSQPAVEVDDATKQIVQLRVVNALQTWIEYFPKDFEDARLWELTELFANGLVQSRALSDSLVRSLRRSRAIASAASAHTEDAATPPIPVQIHTADKEISLLRVPPVELARQIALMDADTYAGINFQELLEPKNWTDPVEHSKAPNVVAMVRRFNWICSWAQTEILREEDVRSRARVIKHLISVCKEARAINDFHAVVALMSAFGTPAIARLHSTNDYLQKRVLGKKEKQFMQEATTLVEPKQNWRNLRKAIESSVPPGIPHIGMFLSDILFMSEGNPNTIGDMLNVSKCRLVAATIKRVLAFQQRRYRFAVVPAIRDWLEGVEVMDQDSLFDLSKRLEPATPSAAVVPATPTISIPSGNSLPNLPDVQLSQQPS